MWRCKKCGSYHISEKIKGTESYDYNKEGEQIIQLWSNSKSKAFCEYCGNEAKKYSFNTTIKEIAEWVEDGRD